MRCKDVIFGTNEQKWEKIGIGFFLFEILRYGKKWVIRDELVIQ